MIKTRMSAKVRAHFDRPSISEQYLLETDFTLSELARICRGEGKNVVKYKVKGIRTDLDTGKTYKEYLAEKNIKLKPRHIRETF